MIRFEPKCPKCQHVLDNYDYQGNCPNCGVDLQEALRESFKRAEKGAARLLKRMLKDEEENRKRTNRPGYEGPRFAHSLVS
ncbi:MAG: hypothetical protein PHE52_02530 [Candidatus Pacebacteria bacterium]|nr:hypothetical protein [Candidatus Paceibacterota bacterium]